MLFIKINDYSLDEVEQAKIIKKATEIQYLAKEKLKLVAVIEEAPSVSADNTEVEEFDGDPYISDFSSYYSP